MPSLQIDTIYATSSFSHTLFAQGSSDNHINVVPNRPNCVWSSEMPNGNCDVDLLNDKTLGSLLPIVLRTPQNLNEKIPISIKGTCDFPESWRGKQFLLIGESVPDFELRPKHILQSEMIAVPEDEKIEVDGLLLNLGFEYFGCPVPVGVNENFGWRLELRGEANSSSTTDVPTAIKHQTMSNMGIRLEIYFTHGPAPNGPLIGDDRIMPRAEFPDGWPTSLFRLFAIQPQTLPKPPPGNRMEWLDFYVDRIMDVIWTKENKRLPEEFKTRYDVQGGRAYYFNATDTSDLRGNFDLDSWMKKMKLRVNCYDLAALTQLACDLVVGEHGEDILNARYIFQNPHGYIHPGPLYGWDAPNDQMRCNNPFWQSSPNPDFTPYVEPTSPKRTRFTSHAWVEINRNGKIVVLDNTRRLKDNPQATTGTLTREEYLSQGLDIENGKIAFEYRSGTISTRGSEKGPGDCRMNPITTLQRIGVTGITGKPNATIARASSTSSRLLPPPSIPVSAGSVSPVLSQPEILLQPGCATSVPMVSQGNTSDLPRRSEALIRHSITAHADPILKLSSGTSRHVSLLNMAASALSFSQNPGPLLGSPSIFTNMASINLEHSPLPSSEVLSHPSFDIDKFIQSGFSSTPAIKSNNTKNLSPEHLFSIPGLFPPREDNICPISLIRTHDDPLFTQISILYFPKGEVESLNMDVHAFQSPTIDESGAGPILALRSHIMKFVTVGTVDQVCPLPPSQQLGACSFATPSAVFWVRGNLFIQIEAELKLMESETAREMVLDFAKRMDDYLAPPAPSSPMPTEGSPSSKLHSGEHDGQPSEHSKAHRTKKLQQASSPTVRYAKPAGIMNTFADFRPSSLSTAPSLLSSPLPSSRSFRSAVWDYEEPMPVDNAATPPQTANQPMLSMVYYDDSTGNPNDNKGEVSFPRIVHPGDMFIMVLSTPPDMPLLPQMKATSSDETVVKPTRPLLHPPYDGPFKSAFELYAVAPGRAVVTVITSSALTMLPVTMQMEVLVSEPVKNPKGSEDL